MKRDPALTLLSRDHHQALYVAHLLTRATPESSGGALSALSAYWSDHGRDHFRAEEEILFPAYATHAPSDPLVDQALRDHDAIRQRIQALDHAAGGELKPLSDLGRLLEKHVRLEERELFPRIEAALSAAELAAVADALERVAPLGTEALGRKFAQALGRKDFATIIDLLDPMIDFRGLTPGRAWEASNQQAVVEEILRQWFEDDDRLEQVVSIDTDSFADRARVAYRLRGRNADGPFIVEQQAYYTERNGRIDWMRVLCSGFRPG